MLMIKIELATRNSQLATRNSQLATRQYANYATMRLRCARMLVTMYILVGFGGYGGPEASSIPWTAGAEGGFEQ